MGTDVGLDPQRHTFASPKAKDTKMLVSFALGDANFLRHPTQNPNASQWNICCVGFQMQNSCIGHVHFILFVSISYALGSQRKHSFSVEYGLMILNENAHNKFGIRCTSTYTL